MIKGWIVGDKETVARLDAMPRHVHDSLVRTMTRLLLRLEAKVKMKLSGEVLKVRTGTLRRSVTSRLLDLLSAVWGIVGTNVKYAAAHEYGFHGTVTVKEHLRTIRTAWGKELKNPVRVSVRSHSRKVDLPEKSFLRSALAEMDGQIRTELAEAVREGVSA